MNYVSELQNHAALSGIEIPNDFPMDGTLFRFSPNGSKNKDGYLSYFINTDGSHVCVYGDWKNHPPGNDFRWCNRDQAEMSAKDRKAFDKVIREARARAEKQRDAEYAAAAKKARGIWEKAKSAEPNHPYLLAKKINPHGIKQWGNALAIPVRAATGQVSSLQYITPDGEKKFMPGGKVAGGCFSIKGNQDVLYIAEGFATGSSIHEITGQTTIVAFNCHNLVKVAEAAREKYPDRQIIIAADNDQFTKGNPGIKAAMGAKGKTNASVAVATFKDVSGKPTDWNDLFLLEGPDEVRRQLLGDVPMDDTERSKDRMRFRFVRVSDIKITPPEYTIDGLLEKNSLVESFGDPGCGKSLNAIDMSCCIATGTPYNGRPAKHGPVGYIAGEGQNGLGLRFMAWAIRHEMDLSSIDQLFVSTVPVALSEKKQLDAIIKAPVALDNGNVTINGMR